MIESKEKSNSKKDGYYFKGWYLNDDFSGEAISFIPDTFNDDITLYAKWVAMESAYLSRTFVNIVDYNIYTLLFEIFFIFFAFFIRTILKKRARRNRALK